MVTFEHLSIVGAVAVLFFPCNHKGQLTLAIYWPYACPYPLLNSPWRHFSGCYCLGWLVSSILVHILVSSLEMTQGYKTMTYGRHVNDKPTSWEWHMWHIDITPTIPCWWYLSVRMFHHQYMSAFLVFLWMVFIGKGCTRIALPGETWFIVLFVDYLWVISVVLEVHHPNKIRSLDLSDYYLLVIRKDL